MSLDVFEIKASFWQLMLGFLIHNIPTIILLIILIFSWKYEIIGGIVFIFAGLLYMILILINMIKNGFEFFYIAWILQVGGIAILIGILYLISWKKKLK